MTEMLNLAKETWIGIYHSWKVSTIPDVAEKHGHCKRSDEKYKREQKYVWNASSGGVDITRSTL
jgi:hypothetical protein